MTIKCRWLSLQVARSQKEISDAVALAATSPSPDVMFHVQQTQPRRLRATCVYEVVQHARTTTIFGEVSRTALVSHEHVQFTLISSSRGAMLMRIDSPPRTLSKFLDCLQKIVGPTIFATTQTLPFTEISAMLSSMLKMRLRAVTMGAVVFEKNVVGKAHLAATEDRELQDFSILSTRPHRVDAYEGSIPGTPQSTEISVSVTNILTCSGPRSHEVVSVLEKWLLERF